MTPRSVLQRRFAPCAFRASEPEYNFLHSRAKRKRGLWQLVQHSPHFFFFLAPLSNCHFLQRQRRNLGGGRGEGRNERTKERNGAKNSDGRGGGEWQNERHAAKRGGGLEKRRRKEEEEEETTSVCSALMPLRSFVHLVSREMPTPAKRGPAAASKGEKHGKEGHDKRKETGSEVRNLTKFHCCLCNFA